MMLEEFKKQNKYVVLKIEDVIEFIQDADQLSCLIDIEETIAFQRIQQGKLPLEGVFINNSSPYIKEAWALIEKEYEEENFKCI